MEHPEIASYALANPLKAGCQSLFGLSNSQTWDDTAKEVRLEAWDMSPREFFQLVGTEWLRDSHDALHWLKRADREINTPPLLPRPLTEAEARDPETPFMRATQEFFGFSDEQIWSTTKTEIDSFWGISPETAIALVKKLATQEFPDFATRRVNHINTFHPEKPTHPELLLDRKEVIIIKDIRFENEAKYIRDLGGEIWHIVRDDATKIKEHSSEAGIAVASSDTVIHNNGTIADYRQKIEEAWASLKVRCAI
ncbi:hypothetical protein BLX42_18350 [Pseudomonas sp. SG-MS2]|nr:hypothetical protein BLX42_18350 [Pseudomonas sp. SG-MS2]